jgi:hypothetical protein
VQWQVSEGWVPGSHSFVLCTWPGSAASLRKRAADAPTFPNSITIGDFSVDYPDGWSTQTAGGVTSLYAVSASQLATLDPQTLLHTAQIRIIVEQRKDHSDALKRLSDFAAETSEKPISLTIGGWPALQRRHLAPWPIPGGVGSSDTSSALTITTAIAAGKEFVRLDGSLPSDAPTADADQIAAIETAVTFATPSASAAAPGPSAIDAPLGGWLHMWRSHHLAERAAVVYAKSKQVTVNALNRGLFATAIADDPNENDFPPTPSSQGPP